MATTALKPDRSGGSARRIIELFRLRRSIGWLWQRLMLPVRAVQGAIYPPFCLVCDTDLEDMAEHFCEGCVKRLVRGEPACARCGLEVGRYVDTSGGCLHCRNEPYRFDAVIRMGYYRDELRELLLSFKSVRNELLGPALSRLFLAHQGAALRAAQADVVVAVPLHYVRRWQRGFNQAESIARRLARQLNLPHHSRILKRIRRTRPQSELKRDQRHDNMRDAFRCKPATHLKGATILLVDDILTTGATCSEAAGALKAAGARRVVVAVVARSQEQSGG